MRPVRRASMQRHLRHDRGDAGIVGRDGDHVAAAEGGAPQRDPLRIDARGGPGTAYRGMVVLSLLAHVDELARLAAARAEMAVVEDQHREPCRGKPLGVDPRQPLRTAEAVTHHDAGHGSRHAIGAIEIGGAGHPG